MGVAVGATGAADSRSEGDVPLHAASESMMSRLKTRSARGLVMGSPFPMLGIVVALHLEPGQSQSPTPVPIC